MINKNTEFLNEYRNLLNSIDTTYPASIAITKLFGSGVDSRSKTKIIPDATSKLSIANISQDNTLLVKAPPVKEPPVKVGVVRTPFVKAPPVKEPPVKVGVVRTPSVKAPRVIRGVKPPVPSHVVRAVKPPVPSQVVRS
jgi:hypothetical protein